MKKLLLSVVIATVSALGSLAQVEGEPNCVGYSAKIYQNTVSELNEENQKLLLNKVDQIIARNSAGKTALYNAFSVVAEFVITDQQMAQTGLQNVHLCKGELTLYAINNIDQSRYGSVITNLSGSGKSKEIALKGLIQSIKATDAVYAKFLKNATSKIVEYYNSNLGVVVKKAETLIAQEKYEEGLNFLQSIPECVPAYMQSAEVIKSLADIAFTKSCESALETAQRYYELKDFAKAKEVLMKVKPDSRCSERAMELAKLIGGLEPAPVAVATTPSVATPTPTQSTPAQPQAVETKSNVTVEHGFNGVEFVFGKCVGNKNDQSISIEFVIKHNKINQSFYSSGSTIYLPDGEQIKGRDESHSVPTGVAVKFTYQFKGILPSVTNIPLLTLNMYSTDANKSDRQTVNFKNIPILWN